MSFTCSCVSSAPCVPTFRGLLLPIVDVQQYSLKDRDTVGEATQKDCLFPKSNCEELCEKNLEIGKTSDLSEGIVYPAKEEGQNRRNCQSRNSGFFIVFLCVLFLPFNSCFTWCFS